MTNKGVHIKESEKSSENLLKHKFYELVIHKYH